MSLDELYRLADYTIDVDCIGSCWRWCVVINGIQEVGYAETGFLAQSAAESFLKKFVVENRPVVKIEVPVDELV